MLARIKLLFILLCFSFCAELTAQNLEWFIHVNTGISRTRLTQPIYGVEQTWEYDWASSWSYQGGISYQVGPLAFLELGLSNTSIRTKEIIQREIFQIDIQDFSSIYLGQATRTSVFASNYIGLPISILIKNKHLGFRTGFQTSFSLKSKTANTKLEENWLQPNPSSSPAIRPPDSPQTPEKIDYGLLLGLQFNITKWLIIDMNYYYGLKTHSKNNDSSIRDSLKRKNEVLSIGLSYYFAGVVEE